MDKMVAPLQLVVQQLSFDSSLGFTKIIFLVPAGSGSNVHVKVCYFGVASAPAVYHYGEPQIDVVRRLPYKTSGADDLALTNTPPSASQKVFPQEVTLPRIR